METNITDNMLKTFFSESKQEIANDGFTQRLMRELPEQTDRGWIVWVFAAIGMAISIYLGITSGLIEYLMVMLKQIPIYYILGGIFCLPLVGTAGFFMTQNKSYGLI